VVVVIPPIIVSAAPECWFYRSCGDVLEMGIPAGAKVFDGTGQRLEVVGGDLRVVQGDLDGTDELTQILSDWLKYSDAIRWSIADWQLSMLLRCAVEHHGWSER
jgi:hypothetical protein